MKHRAFSREVLSQAAFSQAAFSQAAFSQAALSRTKALLGVMVALFSTACGPELDPISTVETLRIIGVRKSAPYARPGERVDLQMLYEDGSGEERDVETFFAFWCVNPPGDLFSQCLSEPPNEEVGAQFVNNSSSFTINLPQDSLRDSLVDPSLPRQGTAFVFYGVCAGRLDGDLVKNGMLNEDAFDGAPTGEALIPRCLDEDGNELGADHFVTGYSTIFIYEELRNENPIITGFEVDGESVEVDCIDEECDAPFAVPDLDGCVDGVPCLKACKDDGELGLCPETKMTVKIDERSAEGDSYAELAYGANLEESLWVSYFVDRGGVTAPLRLVNDATAGWQSDFGSGLLAPKEPGPVRIWAAVRDNRGGVSFTRVPAYIKE
jgi:hypothetical protein